MLRTGRYSDGSCVRKCVRRRLRRSRHSLGRGFVGFLVGSVWSAWSGGTPHGRGGGRGGRDGFGVTSTFIWCTNRRGSLTLKQIAATQSLDLILFGTILVGTILVAGNQFTPCWVDQTKVRHSGSGSPCSFGFFSPSKHQLLP